MIHAYPRRHLFASVLLPDILLVLVLVTVLAAGSPGSFSLTLAVAIPLVLVWGALTLHFPSLVEVTDDGIAFHRYGRVHRFAWRDVRAVHVRRFLVRDRVLVRVVPSPPWRGRYWLLDSLEGFDDLVRGLVQRAQARATAP